MATIFIHMEINFFFVRLTLIIAIGFATERVGVVNRDYRRLCSIRIVNSLLINPP